MLRRVFLLLVFIVVPFAFPVSLGAAQNPSLYVTPSGGIFSVGDTLELSFYLNTGGQAVNALELNVVFPPDKLQVVSPAIDNSFFDVWVAQPSYSNTKGTLRFAGAVKGQGVDTRAGLIASVTFRARSLGSAVVRIADTSRVILADGRGTEALVNATSGLYNLVLPPPEGPIVGSSSHPDQEKWYKNANVFIEWSPNDEEIEGYSYILSHDPFAVLDDISEGGKTGVVYDGLGDGVWYFHIKALRKGTWGGVSRYAFKIDSSPPAKFPVKISPGARTTSKTPVVFFATSDALSGISHYEMAIIALHEPQESFFFEVTEPHVASLQRGRYELVVRAYDKAGNVSESKTKLVITVPVLKFFSAEGLVVEERVVLTWPLVWLGLLILILIFCYLAWFSWRRHRALGLSEFKEVLSDPVIRERFEELRRRRRRATKAGVAALFFLIAATAFWASARAAETSVLTPPVINTISEEITSEDVFYVGGRGERPHSEVIIYLQKLQTGETLSRETLVDAAGNWLYTHSGFLSSGRYLIWAQTRLGDLLSPPSPQREMTVAPAVIELGVSRISYEALYFLVALALFLILLGLVVLTLVHFARGRRRRLQIWLDFATIRKDVEAELAVIAKAKLRGVLAAEEHTREEKLLKDLELLERHLSRIGDLD